jgi:hypothetical protein
LLRPLWIAFRAAFLATAVFWVAIYIVERSGLEVPLGLTHQAVFFVVFFFGVLWVR